MANKTLSEQLCKICGIKPLDNESAYFTGRLGLLPDFENNSNNFVKLFELIVTIETFSFSTGYYYIPYIPTYRQISSLFTPGGEYASYCTDPKKAFLICVIKCVTKEKDVADLIKKQNWGII